MIKTIFKYLLVLMLGLPLFWSCEPCDDCGPDDAYPYFNLTILNRTSLDTLNQSQVRLTAEISVIDSALDNPENIPVVDSLNTLRAVKTDSLSFINALIRTTNDGTISIASINGESNLFENRQGGDSLSRFRIPLNTLQNESEYTFEIEFLNGTRDLKVEYQLFDTTINEKITKSAKNLSVIEHQFDSLRGPFGCQPRLECSSNELEIYVEI